MVIKENISPAIPDKKQGMVEDSLSIAGTSFGSRLLLGSALYPDAYTMLKSLKSAEAEIMTASMRRVNTSDSHFSDILHYIRQNKLQILPNTAGCYTAKEAVLTAKLAREALDTPWIKLEVIGDDNTLYPDMQESLKAVQELTKDGFIVLAYCNDDPVACRKLADCGCAAVMPLGSPIGSGLGILNRYNLEIIREQIRIPLILDAGIGTASDAVMAMEIGYDGVLVNTAIAQAHDPIVMASAFKHAVISGRKAYLAGRIHQKRYANPSSGTAGVIGKCLSHI